MSKEFEIKNNMTFEDEETKIEYQKYDIIKDKIKV